MDANERDGTPPLLTDPPDPALRGKWNWQEWELSLLLYKAADACRTMLGGDLIDWPTIATVLRRTPEACRLTLDRLISGVMPCPLTAREPLAAIRAARENPERRALGEHLPAREMLCQQHIQTSKTLRRLEDALRKHHALLMDLLAVDVACGLAAPLLLAELSGGWLDLSDQCRLAAMAQAIRAKMNYPGAARPGADETVELTEAGEQVLAADVRPSTAPGAPAPVGTGDLIPDATGEPPLVQTGQGATAVPTYPGDVAKP